MKLRFFIWQFIISASFLQAAYGQAADSSKLMVGKLKIFSSARPTEKAHLQFDKAYYAAGDTVYFKAYVTLGEKHRLSTLSGVLHVDLINTANKPDQSVKLQVTDGVAWGDFALPDSLPAGNYKIRAYTRWMNNEGNYFEQAIPIGSLQPRKIPESGIHAKPVNSQPDVQLFPEGGQLTAGILTRVAFKAVGTNGMGTAVKGIVTDNTGKEAARFNAIHLGMGSFYLNPAEGRTYKALVSFADGSKNSIDLPLPNAKGISLSVNNDSLPVATVKIEANAAYYRENKDKPYTLLIYSGGIATTVNIRLDSTVILLDILKRKLSTGIAAITLFSPTGEPISERLIFVQNYDQLSMEIKPDKTSYAKRGKVNISLKVNNRIGEPAVGHFSVSVTDESLVPADENNENTILSNLLLTSDLKGYIEQPNYYFSNSANETQKELDLVMLTHGYRRFEWKQVLNNDDYKPAFAPEKGIDISGQLKNMLNKPINKGTVTLIPAEGGTVLSTTSDNKGMFHFSNLVFTDTTRFVMSAVNARGKNTTKLTYFADKPAPVTTLNNQAEPITNDTAMNAYLVNDKRQQQELLNNGHMKGRMLKQVNIRERKKVDQYTTQSFAGAGNADQVMHADEIERIQGALVTSLDGRLPGITFLGNSGKIPYLTTSLSGLNGANPMLLIIDGSEVPPESINDFNSNEIATVEVLKYASTAAYGMNGANGVLIITTKPGGGRNIKDIVSVGVLPIAPSGFYKAREFYSPKYDNPALTIKERDLRSTIYWNPGIKTGNDGSALLTYYNADGTGLYKIVVEGIDEKGNLGRQVYRYKVN
jgi:TonB-dependent SusC/RagA subfamily outer membrane receptor